MTDFDYLKERCSIKSPQVMMDSKSIQRVLDHIEDLQKDLFITRLIAALLATALVASYLLN